MDRRTALATAGALALTVTGGVSALFLTIGAGDAAAPPAGATEIVEYVDEAGNPLPAATTGVAPTAAVVDPVAGYDEDEHEEHGEDGHEEGDDD